MNGGAANDVTALKSPMPIASNQIAHEWKLENAREYRINTIFWGIGKERKIANGQYEILLVAE